MTSVVLCRHGRTDWNDEGRYQGQMDVPLNSEGLGQARILGQTLRSEPLDAVYSSDLSRASDTATEIARYHSLPVHRDARLREIHQGAWEGLTVHRIYDVWGELHRRWEASPLSVTLPGGESIEDVRRRALPALAEMLVEYPHGVLCLVTHKVVMTVMRCALTGEPLEPALRRLPANASFERIDVPSGFQIDL